MLSRFLIILTMLALAGCESESIGNQVGSPPPDSSSIPIVASRPASRPDAQLRMIVNNAVVVVSSDGFVNVFAVVVLEHDRRNSSPVDIHPCAWRPFHVSCPGHELESVGALGMTGSPPVLTDDLTVTLPTIGAHTGVTVNYSGFRVADGMRGHLPQTVALELHYSLDGVISNTVHFSAPVVFNSEPPAWR